MMALTPSNNTPQNWDTNGEEEGDFRDENDRDEAATTIPTTTSRIEKQHYASTAAICLCTFTHSWLLVSVFPYSGFLVIQLVPGTNEENAGTYAGVLAAAFMMGRALTSYGWGKLADRYGRRIVFFLSLVLSAVFSLLFGLSSSFRLALLWRLLLGASNGVAGISKAVVSETAHGNETLETRGMSLSMGMWAWGFLLSPAISGFLSDPIRQYPDLAIWGSSSPSQTEPHTPIYQFFASYPFVLPNLVSVLLCGIDFVAVLCLVPETLPKEDLRSPTKMPADVWHWLTTFLASSATGGSRNTTNIPNNNIGIDERYPDNITTANDTETLSNNLFLHGEDDVDESDSEWESLLATSSIELTRTQQRSGSIDPLLLNGKPEIATLSYLWSKTDTRNHLIVFWLFSFVAIAIDEAFPLFCISKEGGLGLSESDIGKLLSATGFLFAISQYNVYAWIVDRYGLRRSIQIGAVLSAPLVTFVPLSILFNDTDAPSDTENHHDPTASLTWASFLFLSLLLSFIRIFGLVFFSSITIATNRTVQPSHRGTMNGLSMLGGSIAKGLGPIFAGLLVSSGISSGVVAPKVGAAMVFLVIGGCSAATAGIAFCLLSQNIDHDDNSTSQNEHDCGLCQANDNVEGIGNNDDQDFPQPLLRENLVHRHSNRNNIL